VLSSCDSSIDRLKLTFLKLTRVWYILKCVFYKEYAVIFYQHLPFYEFQLATSGAHVTNTLQMLFRKYVHVQMSISSVKNIQCFSIFKEKTMQEYVIHGHMPIIKDILP
jgi:hypothetical protein